MVVYQARWQTVLQTVAQVKILMGVLHSEIRQRMTRQFELLASGEDAPPGPRYRLEGFMEAAVMTGDVDVDTLRLMIAERHLSLLGETVEQRLGDDWELWHPFPQIPAFTARAPVSPSTSD